MFNLTEGFLTELKHSNFIDKYIKLILIAMLAQTQLTLTPNQQQHLQSLSNPLFLRDKPLWLKA